MNIYKINGVEQTVTVLAHRGGAIPEGFQFLPTEFNNGPVYFVNGRLTSTQPPPSADEQLQRDFRNAGITAEAMIEALWREQVEGQPGATAAIQAKRDSVNRSARGE